MWNSFRWLAPKCSYSMEIVPQTTYFDFVNEINFVYWVENSIASWAYLAYLHRYNSRMYLDPRINTAYYPSITMSMIHVVVTSYVNELCTYKCYAQIVCEKTWYLYLLPILYTIYITRISRMPFELDSAKESPWIRMYLKSKRLLLC